MILRAENIFKTYGKRTVVKDVSYQVQQGEIVGLLGPNGAGKTTSFYMTVGFIKPTAGHVYLDDEEITDPDALYDQAVAIVLENKRASISLVQRHLRIGYNRAARLLEDMEKAGLVSKMGGNGNREILVSRPTE